MYNRKRFRNSIKISTLSLSLIQNLEFDRRFTFFYVFFFQISTLSLSQMIMNMYVWLMMYNSLLETVNPYHRSLSLPQTTVI